MLAAGVDTIALGCTHYPLIESLIAELAGSAVTIINPAPAAARRIAELLIRYDLKSEPGLFTPLHRFYSSGDSMGLTAILRTVDFSRRLVFPYYQVTRP
jgi:glutamate racemase